MHKTIRLSLLICMLILCVGCDQATKTLAQQNLMGQAPQSFLNGLFRLHYAENPGAFLSLGANLSPEVRFWIFTVLASALLIGMAVFLIRYAQQMSIGMALATTLLLGGGFSNLIDRVFNEGRVVDFMVIGVDTEWISLYTGVFNFADMAIMTGTGLLMIFMREATNTPATDSP
ncbi:MAG: signal peptidase II [Chloroflexota bacterium]